jgi:hypothetical protein
MPRCQKCNRACQTKYPILSNDNAENAITLGYHCSKCDPVNALNTVLKQRERMKAYNKTEAGIKNTRKNTIKYEQRRFGRYLDVKFDEE